jgi:hypothetical protein
MCFCGFILTVAVMRCCFKDFNGVGEGAGAWSVKSIKSCFCSFKFLTQHMKDLVC